ncbi:MAG: inositol-3-phosphate synthase [bacterium]|nr:inositol-3-phosphate synthase [bacterium]
MAPRRIGIWFLGARGGVASTTIIGLEALKKGLTENAGLVSELPQFADVGFSDWGSFVVGGHEIREGTLIESIERLQRDSRIIDAALLEGCRNELEEIDQRIKPGVLTNVGDTIRGLAEAGLQSKAETPRGAIERVKADISEFAEQNDLTSVLVVNVASTEPPVDVSVLPETWAELSKSLETEEGTPLAASSLYAIAAFELGYGYINFTPSLGSIPAALQELALEKGVCHIGRDGKTGETLLKSALAPMFAARNLNIMSWVGHNIFGNMDGQVLDDPVNKKTKVVSKDQLLGEILGYDPQTHISIEYIKSLGDWKTAWDHIHFRGFLGTPMTMQFTWQGCDSILAAPLVLDLIRFTDAAEQRGEKGVLTFLSSFFKSPMNSTENDFVRQFQQLEAWADSANQC